MFLFGDLFIERGVKSVRFYLNLKLDIFVLISMGNMCWKFKLVCFLILIKKLVYIWCK